MFYVLKVMINEKQRPKLRSSYHNCRFASEQKDKGSVSVVVLDSVGDSTDSIGNSTEEWIRQGGRVFLTAADKEHILCGKKLDDRHINFAPSMLKQQFSQLAGLRSTLLQTRKHTVEGRKQQIQTVHSKGDHWIVAFSILTTGDEVLTSI